jgi:hypothetical protein
LASSFTSQFSQISFAGQFPQICFAVQFLSTTNNKFRRSVFITSVTQVRCHNKFHRSVFAIIRHRIQLDVPQDEGEHDQITYPRNMETSVFTTSSPRVHHVFTTSSPRVHHVFTTSSPRLHHVFTTCPAQCLVSIIRMTIKRSVWGSRWIGRFLYEGI